MELVTAVVFALINSIRRRMHRAPPTTRESILCPRHGSNRETACRTLNSVADQRCVKTGLSVPPGSSCSPPQRDRDKSEELWFPVLIGRDTDHLFSSEGLTLVDDMSFESLGAFEADALVLFDK